MSSVTGNDKTVVFQRKPGYQGFKGFKGFKGSRVSFGFTDLTSFFEALLNDSPRE